MSGPVPFGICSDCRLTGETTAHQSNHYLTGVTALAIAAVAGDFKEEFQATLGLNDMSLEGGGLFDIGPTTQFPNGAFWHAPHNFHREGKSVDIDQCAESTIEDNPNPRGPIIRTINGVKVTTECDPGMIKVPRLKFERICRRWGGHLEIESVIHCEF